MSSSVGKRQRERQKRERAQVKAERKVVRQTTNAEESFEPSSQSETELIEELGALQRGVEKGAISPEDFDEGRSRIQSQLERLPQ